MELKWRKVFKRNKRLLCSRRFLSFGEKMKIIEMRFGSYGSQEVVGPKFSVMARLLKMPRGTIVNVCRRYCEKNG